MIKPSPVAAGGRPPSMPSIVPVILAGGSGTRLWPASTPSRPKQFLKLGPGDSLLADALSRARRVSREAPLIVGARAHRFLLQEHAGGQGGGAHVLLEPCARDSAAAIAAAAAHARRDGRDPVLCVMPSDAHVGGMDAWRAAVKHAVQGARQGHVVVMGKRATRPETGYGYIEPGRRISGALLHVAAFKEKPDLATAERFVADGLFWNCGIFIAKASVLEAQFKAHAPEIWRHAAQGVARAHRDLGFTLLDEEAFAQAPAMSFDYAVMERTKDAAVVEAGFDWSDLGSWEAVREIGDEDANGNVAHGNVHLADAHNSYVRSDKVLVVLDGVEDLSVIATEGAVLVSDRRKPRDLKETLRAVPPRSRAEAERPRRDYRPWGSFEFLATGDGCQVKRIVVAPGRRLSLQKHECRAEHWVVVSGSAVVTRDDETLSLKENESVHLPLGCAHRLANPSETGTLVLIEVQCGPYLGEDDIIRLQDDYRRD